MRAPFSWLSPKVSPGESPIHGRGLFAREDLAGGEIVAVKGGHVFDRGTLAEVAPRLGSAEIQVTGDLFIGPLADEDREGSMIFSNHSCDPNLGVAGQIVFVTLRAVRAGEELTHDWAMTDDDDSTMECRCGAASCRGIVTGRDWQKPELLARYGEHVSWYLRRKARALGLLK